MLSEINGLVRLKKSTTAAASEIRGIERSTNIVNMAVIIVNVSLYIFSLLALSVMANVMELAPLCGTMDGSAKKDSDKIYFIDKTEPVRKVEVNGTIYGCYPDGTMIKSNSSLSTENSGKKTGSKLQDRILNGNRFDICLSHTNNTNFFHIHIQ